MKAGGKTPFIQKKRGREYYEIQIVCGIEYLAATIGGRDRKEVLENARNALRGMNGE